MTNVHDSILVQCDDDPQTIEYVSTVMESEMRIPIPWDGGHFYIPTDCKVGYNWGSQSKDNPRGLRDIEKWFDKISPRG